MSLGARVGINLDALVHNLNRLSSSAPNARVIAAVKANAYGHGIVEIATALPNVDSLAVARLAEAEVLRRAGVATPILLMGGFLGAEELAKAEALCCDLVIHNQQQVAWLEQRPGAVERIWLKVDTGMRRLGVAIDEAHEFAARIGDCRGGQLPGLMTHMACADDLNSAFSDRQASAFAALAEGYAGDISIANSAVLLGWPQHIAPDGENDKGRSIWVRPGISLYGISPISGRPAAEFDLRPVMNFDARLIAVKSIGEGDTVGYGATWRASRRTTIGIVSAGYGDGYSRFLPSGTPVLVNGRRASLAGVVSMDLMAIDLGEAATDAVGDWVRLWGEGMPVEEVAEHADTTAYPLVTGVRIRG